MAIDIERVKCDLRRDGYAVIDPFITLEQLEIVRNECETLRELVNERGTPWATAASAASCIFETLPGHLCEARPDLRTSYSAYKAARSTWPLQAAAWEVLFRSQLTALASALLGPTATLFNDQYIVKPPNSGDAASFRWHRDSEWCREGTAAAPYLSIWIALDGMAPENGCLVVRPGSHATAPDLTHIPGLEPEGLRREAAPPVALSMPAGAAVVTADVVEHASGPNDTPYARRAWMPQLSAGPITWQASGAPVSLAIPLVRPSAE